MLELITAKKKPLYLVSEKGGWLKWSWLYVKLRFLMTNPMKKFTNNMPSWKKWHRLTSLKCTVLSGTFCVYSVGSPLCAYVCVFACVICLQRSCCRYMSSDHFTVSLVFIGAKRPVAAALNKDIEPGCLLSGCHSVHRGVERIQQYLPPYLIQTKHW